MARGETVQEKVHYKGTSDDFLVFLENAEDYQKWQQDRSIPLAQVVSSFKIFVTHKQGVQGTLDAASKAELDNEFGTHVEEEVITKILEKGSLSRSQMPERQGRKNDSQGEMLSH